MASFYDFLKESLIRWLNSSDLSKIDVKANAANAAVIGANKRSPLKQRLPLPSEAGNIFKTNQHAITIATEAVTVFRIEMTTSLLILMRSFFCKMMVRIIIWTMALMAVESAKPPSRNTQMRERFKTKSSPTHIAPTFTGVIVSLTE